ncbi:MAG: hypothetical protein Q8926_15620, partial [Bacteroidota bacterium]|nr:hypothetical protein [Bacteroidota bacterium]
MKKLLGMALILFVSHAALAQDSTAVKKKNTKPAVLTRDSTGVTRKKTPVTYESLNLANRPNDHFMIQLGYDNWAGKPDTIRTTGLSRSFAFYFMMDFPFKTDPHFSVGAGLGIGVSNIYFDKQEVLVEATG